jgi:acyl carrier protein
VFSHAIKSCAQHPTSRATDFAGFSGETTRNISDVLYRPKISTPSINETIREVPTTAAQQEICEILSAFAHIPTSQLCLDTTIHQIGLDSISSIQLASQLRNLKKINITAAHILERPSVRDLARFIENKTMQGSASYVFDFATFEERYKSRICSSLGTPVQKVENIRPCTALQMGLASQFLRSGTLYSNHVTYQFDASCSLHELREAWETVTNLHVMLRTGFVELDDPIFSFAMVTYPPFEHSIPVEICSSSENLAVDTNEWRERCTNRFHENMSMPPWAVLLEEKDDNTFMHLTIFHGLYDAQSLSQILHDLASVCIEKVYPQTEAVEPVLSMILGSSISMTSDKEIQDQTEYWKEMLGSASINPFPNMTPFYSSTRRFAVFAKHTSRRLHQLESRCSHIGVTLQAVGMAAWAQLLSAYIGEPSVTFGVVLSGRDMLVEAENAVFPCVTTVPISVPVPKGNKELVDKLMKLSANARKHQFTPIGEIQRCLGRPNEVLFDTIFAFQKISGKEYSKPWKIVDEVSTAEVRVWFQ